MKDPYVYEGTDVLINLRNLKNKEDLDEFESSMFKLSFIDLNEKGFIVKTTEDIFEIHRIVFSKVYEWAGKPRIINIEKSEEILGGLSVKYSDYDQIIKEIKELDNDFKKIKKGDKNIVNEIATVISRLWGIHAFREGNTRSTALFLYYWMNNLGLKLNNEFIGEHAKYFRNALVLANIGEYSEYIHLEKILMDAMSDNQADTKKSKYKIINGYNLDNYNYNYHHIKD